MIHSWQVQACSARSQPPHQLVSSLTKMSNHSFGVQLTFSGLRSARSVVAGKIVSSPGRFS